jgi:hypothetical protein
MSWTPSTSSAKSLVDLQEWDDLLHRPEVVPAVSPVDLAVHRHLEQDRSHNPVAAEARTRDDAAPHLVDAVEHLILVGVLVLAQPVEPQRPPRAAPTLVESGDEPLAVADLLELLLIHRLAPSRSSVGPTPHLGEHEVAQ